VHRGLGVIAVFIIFLLVLTSPFLFHAVRGFSKVPEPEPEPGQGEACVRDTTYMRENHMKMLKEAREEVVREGIRVEERSLRNCRSCHPSKERFCDKCHNYAGVRPQCFNCHYYE
jgi:hypothetical protein